MKDAISAWQGDHARVTVVSLDCSAYIHHDMPTNRLTLSFRPFLASIFRLISSSISASSMSPLEYQMTVPKPISALTAQAIMAVMALGVQFCGTIQSDEFGKKQGEGH